MRIAIAAITAFYWCSAFACTAIVVGKKASATGNVIVSHNIDTSGPKEMRYSLIPARTYKEGDLMVQEDDTAKIPQIGFSYSCFWAEIKALRGGNATPGDHFLNEHGVMMVSNNGGVVKSWGGVEYSLPEEGYASAVVDGGLKHNFRRAVIERSRTAREALCVATNLIETWGYAYPSRIFTIADKDEAFVLQVLKGRRYIARRCPDDAVVAYPNCLTIGKIEPGDIVSSSFRTKGPDFHFIKAYQGPRTWKDLYNLYRWKMAYKIAALVDVPETKEYPFSVRPRHKVTPEDLVKALSSHYENTSFALKNHHPLDGQTNIVPICRMSTKQSAVCLFANDPKDTMLYIATGRPCETPFLEARPFSGIVPKGTVFGEKAIKRLDNHSKPEEQE